MDKKFKCPQPIIGKDRASCSNGASYGERWCDKNLVTYPVSYQYNGRIVLDGKWYAGYEVPDPIVPKGFELVGIGCGLELNAHPPLATRYLKPIE